MAFSWGTFKKLQDDDLVADLARRQADEEGRLRIVNAQGDLVAQRERAAAHRDAIENSRVYREGLLEEREAERKRREASDADNRLKVEREEEQYRNAQRILEDPNASPDLKKLAGAFVIGVRPSYSVQDEANSMVPVYTRRRDGTLVRQGDVEKDAKIAPDTTPAPSFTLIAGEQGQHLFNRRTGQLSDEPVMGLAPTATMRERGMAYESLQPFLDYVEDLSGQINQLEGIYATVQGTVDEAQAKVNLDNMVAEYQRTVESMMPLAARAFGHTGVLTQQDVDSARAIIPRPTDSRDLRNRLMANLKTITSKVHRARQSDPYFRAYQETKGQKPANAVGAAAGAVRQATPAPSGEIRLMRDPKTGKLVPQP